MEARASIFTGLQETIASIPLIKALSSESRESQRFANALEDSRQITLQQNVVGSVASLAINSGPDLVKGIVLIIGAYLAIRGD